MNNNHDFRLLICCNFADVKSQNQPTMKRIGFLLMAFVSVIVLTGCPGKEPDYIDLGTIPEEYLATVPYEDGQTFYLQHESDRLIIPFKVTRQRGMSQGNDAWGFDNHLLEKYKPAPTVYFNYEVDATTCKPDYPLFDIDIRFSNAYLAEYVYQGYTPSVKYAQLTILNLMAPFPLIGDSTEQFTVLDSLEVNGHTYHDVFEFVNEGQDFTDIYVKATYYNYEKGVIAIYMSNGERYLLYEEE